MKSDTPPTMNANSEFDQALRDVDLLREALRASSVGREVLVDLLLITLISEGTILIRDYRGSDIASIVRGLGHSIEKDDKSDNCFHRVRLHGELDLISTLRIDTAVDGKSELAPQVLFLEGIEDTSLKFQGVLSATFRERVVTTPNQKIKVRSLFFPVVTQYQVGNQSKFLSDQLVDSFTVQYEAPLLEEPQESELLRLRGGGRGWTGGPVISVSSVNALSMFVRSSIELPDEISSLIVQLAYEIARDENVAKNGHPSPRSQRDLAVCLRACAFVRRRGKEVSKKDIQFMAPFCFSGHTIRKAKALLSTRAIVKIAMKKIPLLAEGEEEIARAQSEERSHELSPIDCWNIYENMHRRISSNVKGRDNDGGEGISTIELLLSSVFTGGHLLLEDYPGSGKSFLAQQLEECVYDDIPEPIIDIETYHRIQCTPDLLPTDVTGYMMLKDGKMEFQKGPIFAYFVLIDEINRTTPKVQSAFLEAMAERRVTVDDTTYKLGRIFFAIATQNPLDNVGTFPLPAASLDRFLFKRRLAPLDKVSEAEVMTMGNPSVYQEWLRLNPDLKPREKQRYTVQSAPLESGSKIPISKLEFAKEAILNFCDVDPTCVTALQNLADIIGSYCEVGGHKRGAGRFANISLREGSRPSARTMQRLFEALKVLAFTAMGRQSPEKLESGELVRAKPDLIVKIAPDFLRHRIFPSSELEPEELDEFIRHVANEAVAQTTLKS